MENQEYLGVNKTLSKGAEAKQLRMSKRENQSLGRRANRKVVFFLFFLFFLFFS